MNEQHAVDRRALLRMCLLAVPALAIGPGRVPEVWSTDGRWRFFSAPDGIYAEAPGFDAVRLLPLGRSYALRPRMLAADMKQLTYTALDRHTGLTLWSVPVVLRDGVPVAGTPAPLRAGPAAAGRFSV